MKRFHKEALRLLASGKAREVPGLVKRSVFLQIFGPQSAIDAKLGLAYLQSGQFTHAVTCLENAIPDAPLAERMALEIGAAKARFVTGDFERAEAMAGMVQRKGTRLAELICIVARCRIAAKKTGRETTALLEEAEGLSPSPDVKWMLALVWAEHSLATGSKRLELPDGDDPKDGFSRGWTHLVRGRIREKDGEMDAARDHFREAKKLGADTFVAAEIGARGKSNEPRKLNGAKLSGQGKGPSKRKRRKRR